VDKHEAYLETRLKIEAVFEHYAAQSEYYRRANIAQRFAFELLIEPAERQRHEEEKMRNLFVGLFMVLAWLMSGCGSNSSTQAQPSSGGIQYPADISGTYTFTLAGTSMSNIG
jgi:hypothetical protein